MAVVREPIQKLLVRKEYVPRDFVDGQQALRRVECVIMVFRFARYQIEKQEPPWH